MGRRGGITIETGASKKRFGIVNTLATIRPQNWEVTIHDSIGDVCVYISWLCLWLCLVHCGVIMAK